MSEGLGVAVRAGASTSAVGARPARRLAWLLCASLVAGFGCSDSDPVLLVDPTDVRQTTGTVVGTLTSNGLPAGGVNLRTDPAGATGRSDASGAFRLEGVLPGRVTVVAEGGGFLRGSRTVVVVGDREATADIVLFPAAGTGSLQGVVTDGSVGLAEVRISTVPASQSPITSADGRYDIPGLAPGPYRVTATRLGYDTVQRIVQVLEGRAAQQDFALAARDDGRIEGVVTDSVGQPLVMAQVDLFFGSDVVTAFTDANGVYSFSNLITGFYVLGASQAGFLPGSKGLDVRGGSRSNGDLVLYTSATPAPVPGSIAGTVFDDTDAPVTGVTVTLSAASNPASVVTGADGTFTFVDVPTGSVVVTLTPAGGAPFLPAMRTIVVGAGQTADASVNLARQ